MTHTINDSFMNPDRFGYAVMPFKLNGDREPPKHVSVNVVSRSNARSMGKAMYEHTRKCRECSSFLRRVYNNSCYTCWKENKKPRE